MSGTINKVVIPVAGLGTRLLPATKSQPKEMLPVGRKPVVQYVVEEMIEQHLTKYLFITGRSKRSIEDHFDRDPYLMSKLAESGNTDLLDEIDYEAKGVNFFYTRQSSPAGLGDAIRLAEDFAGDDHFVVALGDTIVRSNGRPNTLVRRMIDAHTTHKASCTIAVWDVERNDVRQYGIVQPVGEVADVFEISDIVEKPSPSDAPSCVAVAARYILSPAIFPTLREIEPGVGGEVQLTDAIRLLIRRGHRVICVKLQAHERRYDIGNTRSYFEAFIDFALSDRTHGQTLRRYIRKSLGET
ncbi:MAG: UTP--glucose-1-phosphate uridylyltransferase [Candidatus Latescibacteria bacterium]|nr:UTP--glucose-1-phosphate uridylyltransferase [Candidatus Latescibacterota bacterium]